MFSVSGRASWSDDVKEKAVLVGTGTAYTIFSTFS